MLLRGVNLAGSSKFPIGASTHVTKNFYNTSGISFVGRPFPLAEADEHFARLRAWGLTFVRLLVPWEAVEHRVHVCERERDTQRECVRVRE